jgi:hypothetical protein
MPRAPKSHDNNKVLLNNAGLAILCQLRGRNDYRGRARNGQYSVNIGEDRNNVADQAPLPSVLSYRPAASHAQ